MSNYCILALIKKNRGLGEVEILYTYSISESGGCAIELYVLVCFLLHRVRCVGRAACFAASCCSVFRAILLRVVLFIGWYKLIYIKTWK